MEKFLSGFHLNPKEVNQSDEETFEFNPNEKSLTEGSEYLDDSLRMVEQPYNE